MKLRGQAHLPLLANNTIFYLIGLMCANALTFITFPILARGMSSSDFGIFDLFASFSILITILFAFGIDSSVGRYFYEIDDVERRRKLVFESMIVQSLVIITIGSSFYFMAEHLIGYVTTDESHVVLLRLSILQAAFQAILNFVLSLLKWSSEKWKFIILSVVSSGLGLCLSFIAIYGFNADLGGVFELVVIGRIFSAAFGLYLIRNWLMYSCINYEFSGRLIRYAIPIGIVCVVDVIVPMLERKSILEIVSAEHLGQYAAAAKLVSILAVIVQAFQAAWGPLSLSVRKQERANETYSITAKIFVLAICLCALLMTYFGKSALILVVSHRYQEAYVLIFPMAMGLAIQATGMITGLGIQISLRSHYQIVSQVIFFIVAALSISHLTNYFGIVGTAYAVLLSIVIRTLTLSALSQYAHPIKWPFRSICSTLVATFLFGTALNLLQINFDQWISAVFILLSLLVLICGSWYFSLNSNERLMLCAMFTRQ
jgi:O-antigen/teichoic acid export membrane protein